MPHPLKVLVFQKYDNSLGIKAGLCLFRGEGLGGGKGTQIKDERA